MFGVRIGDHREYVTMRPSPEVVQVLDALTEEQFYAAIRGKLMGQVNVVRLASGLSSSDS
jgi:hypothetical protein